MGLIPDQNLVSFLCPRLLLVTADTVVTTVVLVVAAVVVMAVVTVIAAAPWQWRLPSGRAQGFAPWLWPRALARAVWLRRRGSLCGARVGTRAAQAARRIAARQVSWRLSREPDAYLIRHAGGMRSAVILSAL